MFISFNQHVINTHRYTLCVTWLYLLCWLELGAIHPVVVVVALSGPWQRNFVDARFFSSTCFGPSGAAQQQLGFWIFTSGTVRVCLNVTFFRDVIQEAQSKDLLHTSRLSVRLDRPLHGNNARGAKYAVYYASVVTHTVFENIKWLHSALGRNRNVAVLSLACLFPGSLCFQQHPPAVQQTSFLFNFVVRTSWNKKKSTNDVFDNY